MEEGGVIRIRLGTGTAKGTASKIALKVFIDVSLTISVGNLFQYETAESMLATAGLTPLLLEPKGVALCRLDG